ncbi:Hypothetical protein CAP_7946 [Chondromyces apiculatus DSM 436]|uniref:Uncharacterized protein n=1 Tax=Chondromyces apiculatus DSM 436 TaxID=1192034 RepID=A0A017SY01_9BACT|nr:Hypothetical protein CAP_7946 [Chondromyces apiculatus DSM 436]
MGPDALVVVIVLLTLVRRAELTIHDCPDPPPERGKVSCLPPCSMLFRIAEPLDGVESALVLGRSPAGRRDPVPVAPFRLERAPEAGDGSVFPIGSWRGVPGPRHGAGQHGEPLAAGFVGRRLHGEKKDLPDDLRGRHDDDDRREAVVHGQGNPAPTRAGRRRSGGGGGHGALAAPLACRELAPLLIYPCPSTPESIDGGGPQPPCPPPTFRIPHQPLVM